MWVRRSALVVVAALWMAVVACGSPDREGSRTTEVSALTSDRRSSTSLPEQGDVSLTVEGQVVEVLDPAAIIVGGDGTAEVVVIVRRSARVQPGLMVRVTGIAQVLDVDELERQLMRRFDGRVRSFDGERVIVADEVQIAASDTTDGDR